MDSLAASMGSLAVQKTVGPNQGAIPKTSTKTIFKELLEIEESDGTIANQKKIDCAICLTAIDIGNGVVLRNCLHSFCKDCINRLIVTADSGDIKCPHIANKDSCQEILQDKEIRALLSAAEYDEYLAKTLRLAENSAANSFHCLTPNCQMWCIVDENVRKFRCAICRALNCIPCKAIHPTLSCAQFRSARRATDGQSKTKQVLEAMVDKGDGMYCPKCKAFITKPEGCDWIRCTPCKTEICWVTKSYRWGPGGNGDFTGGCKCKLNGKLCHPDCQNCH